MATFFSASTDQRDLAGGGDMSFHYYTTTSNPYSDTPTGGLIPFPATIMSEGHVAHGGDGRDEPTSFLNARDGPSSGAEMGLQTQLLMANASAAQHQGLSLSLGTQGVPVASLYQYRQAGMAAASLLSPVQTTTASRNAQSIYIQNSKYLKAARELLDEVVNVRDAIKRKGDKNHQSKDSGEGKDAEKSEEKADEHEGNSSAELTPSERQDLQNKVSALMALLDQVIFFVTVSRRVVRSWLRRWCMLFFCCLLQVSKWPGIGTRTWHKWNSGGRWTGSTGTTAARCRW